MVAMDATVQPPQSVTWQVHIDRSMWIGGVRGLMLQALHPIAMRGVWQNSTFQDDPIGRLQRTADFVGVVTWGTAEEADRLGRKVRGIHKALRIKDPDTGRVHRVDDPELLLWVHCAEVASYLHVVRRSGYPLTDAQADAYVAENRESARLVGLDPAGVPGDTAELRAYFAAVRPELAATPEAREVDAFLRKPPIHALLVPARDLIWGRFAALAYASLPSYAHALYGRPAPAPATVTRRLRATGRALRRIPPTVRWQLPPKHILRAVERLGPGTRPSPRNLRDPAVPDRAGW